MLSRLDIDELVSEVAKEIHHYFDIDAISIVLRSDRKNKLSIYSTHYLDEHHPAHEQSEVDEAGTLSERVFKSKEMLLINLSERDTPPLTKECCSKPGATSYRLCACCR